jgi:O-antigen/teichoic acid export membrane protein
MSFREVFLAVMQKYERMDLMAGSRVSQGLFSLLLFGCFFWFTKNFAFAMIGLVIARIIVLLFYDFPVSKRLLHENDYPKSIVPYWHLNIIWKLTKTTAPLGLVAWLTSLFVSLPRLFLDKFIGREEVGYFVAMSSLLVAGTLVVTALTQAVSPRLALYYIENIKAYKALLLKLILVGIGLGITGIIIASFAGKFILQILFTPEYAQYNNVFIILVVAGSLLILFTFMNVGLTAARKFLIQVPLYTACVIVCLISSFCFIPKLRMTGAAISLILCYATGLAGCSYYVRKAIKARLA